MKTKIKQKKYFLNDSELTTVEEDRLNQKNIVKNLNLIVENENPPYNIALIGKWGIGKSSIINVLLSKYKNDTDNYIVQEINAWKHENDSLKEVFEKKLKESIYENESKSSEKFEDLYNYSSSELENYEIDKQLEHGKANSKFENYDIDNKHENSNNNITFEEYKPNSGYKLKNADNSYIKVGSKATNKTFNKSSNIKKNVLKTFGIFLLEILVTTIIFVIYEYLQNIIIYKGLQDNFIKNTFITYCENIVPILIFALILSIIWVVIKQLYNKPMNEKESVLKTRTEYVIKEKGDTVKHKKVITIIEDLDKLTINKMLKTVDEIKFLTESKDCIFIVPFDDSILKKALNYKKIIKLDGNYKPIQIEQLIDKVFDYKVYIPPLMSLDIKNYAVNLVQENIPNFIAEYCPIDIFEDVIRKVLIYKKVTTPRHVKKNINAFVNNKILITNQIKQGKYNEELLNDNELDFKIARLSVLQSDFRDFYDVLCNNFDYINKMLEYCDSNVKLSEIDDDLRIFFRTKTLEIQMPDNLNDYSQNIENTNLQNHNINNKTYANKTIVEIKPEYKSLIYFLKRTKKYKIETIAQLIFEEEKYDKTFKEMMPYWDKETIEDIFNKLSIKSKFNEKKKNYNREKNIFEIMCIEDNKEYITKFLYKIVENYKMFPTNTNYFMFVNEIIQYAKKYMEEQLLQDYLKIVIENYDNYPNEAIEIFKSLGSNIPYDMVQSLFIKLKNNLTDENYEDTFNILKNNSEPFYEENGNLSEYVQFLVGNIGMSNNPDEVINELDENFSRIGGIYELNKNIKGMSTINFDNAFKFIAKCLDNGSLNRMILDINKILSDEGNVQDCLNIEHYMVEYSLIDVIKYDVENIEKILNSTLLKNLIEICVNTQSSPNDTLKFVSKSLTNIEDSQYILDVFTLLSSFDRMYFYEIRRDFIETLYSCFHNTNNMEVKLASLQCAKYFKITLLFRNKLSKEELDIYNSLS